ncbi:hypothetical protein IQ07DRAFT_24788 [Pyrenochaeta sp. DS3sAY3a]|nr:hypothetical protein IQ07DRAFT_24788 [Pyrenochaeta sp. DS3sAY3a]
MRLCGYRSSISRRDVTGCCMQNILWQVRRCMLIPEISGTATVDPAWIHTEIDKKCFKFVFASTLQPVAAVRKCANNSAWRGLLCTGFCPRSRASGTNRTTYVPRCHGRESCTQTSNRFEAEQSLWDSGAFEWLWRRLVCANGMCGQSGQCRVTPKNKGKGYATGPATSLVISIKQEAWLHTWSVSYPSISEQRACGVGNLFANCVQQPPLAEGWGSLAATDLGARNPNDDFDGIPSLNPVSQAGSFYGTLCLEERSAGTR